MTKKKARNIKTLSIKEAIFFPEDFRKLPSKVIISIDQGMLIIPEGKKYKIVRT